MNEKILYIKTYILHHPEKNDMGYKRTILKEKQEYVGYIRIGEAEQDYG